ncbi:MAG: hypothetical protein IJ518_03820 [Clostridia bacterium]|nr:hypothetical protein [Clostridia bacterium]
MITTTRAAKNTQNRPLFLGHVFFEKSNFAKNIPFARPTDFTIQILWIQNIDIK